ncbi:MAG: hypothetical protein PHQ72_12565 [Hespellia sp.]|nr:hypothetical protein [Hespellia sp.]
MSVTVQIWGVRGGNCKIRRKELSIKIDYLSIVFENYTAEECIYEIIGLPFICFQVQEARIKHQDYTSLYQFGTIKIYGDRKRSPTNPEGKGCYLVLTGSGCDDYYSYLCTMKHSYSDFFRRCQKKAGTNHYHLTRLDVAIDDRNEIPYFTIEQIKRSSYLRAGATDLQKAVLRMEQPRPCT